MKHFCILAIISIPFLSGCATRVRNSQGITILETYGDWINLNYTYVNGKEKVTLTGTVNHSNHTAATLNGASMAIGSIGAAVATKGIIK